MFHNFIYKDDNSQLVAVRSGNPLGGWFTPPSNVVADTWYRIFPSASDGASVDGDLLGINIGSLRSDILDIIGWKIKTLNEGYVRNYVIDKYDPDSGIATLSGVLDKNLPTNIKYVLYPKMLFPLGINYSRDASDKIDIGIALEDDIAPSTFNKYDDLVAKESIMIQASRVDKLFYRFDEITSISSNKFSWGEHYRF